MPPSPTARTIVVALSLGLAGGAAARAQEPAVKPSQSPSERPPNQLAASKSPYLRQHAHNPVDWQPWGQAALARAAREQKPIFLSIGYAACHWCHVMERESFMDPAVAKLLNEHFVCIKVDREERPDVDEIYLAALQAMGQSGGWPLSMFLTPERQPFFGGTYFPPQDAHGRPGFRRVLEHLIKAWTDDRQQITTSAGELAGHLRSVLAPELPPGEPVAALLDAVLPQALGRFDAVHGGFAEPPTYAPKFPPPLELQVLLRLLGDEPRRLAQTTLQRMREGGLYDQLGGGFHRYSTDRQWRVPHFEKMLYDNALLAACYLDGHRATGEADFARVARETLDFLLREMRDPRGGFHASHDADSDGGEGRFFVWQRAEFDAVLGPKAALAARHFGVTAAGNWEGENVLVLAEPAAALAAATDQPAAEVEAALASARQALFDARARRPRPRIDDKVLCGWNGLAIEAFAAGHRELGDARYLQAAQQAAAFVLQELVADGRCQRSWHSGTAQHQGLLEDHALLADALLSLFEADGDPRWLRASRDLLARIEQHFGAADGGFFTTADDHEELLARSRSLTDAATPSGAGAAARAFLRAGLLLGDERLYARGVAGLRAGHALLQQMPASAPSLVRALQFHVGEPREVVVAGAPGDPRTQALLRAAWQTFPGPQVVALVHDGNREALAKVSPLFAGKTPRDGVPAAYVCRRGVCGVPVTDPQALGGGR